MIPVDGSFLYTTGKQIQPLTALRQEMTFGEALLALFVAEYALETLLVNSIYQLRTSRQDGQALLSQITAMREKASHEDHSKQTLGYELNTLNSMLARFEAVFAAELRVSALYLVSQQKALDTAAVILDGSSAFPSDLAQKAPAALPDTRDAMKCIVFELPTAAGFHLHRANESVLQAYYHAVTSGERPPNLKTIGEYLKKLDELKVGDDRVKAALRDLNKLHRNPLIHPEQRLETVDEAYALYCSVFAAMEPMLKAIPAPALVAAPSGPLPSVPPPLPA